MQEQEPTTAAPGWIPAYRFRFRLIAMLRKPDTHLTEMKRNQE